LPILDEECAQPLVPKAQDHAAVRVCTYIPLFGTGATLETSVYTFGPTDAEAAKALESPARREAVGRYLSSLLKGRRAGDVLAEAIAEAKRAARTHGLTAEEIDAELDEWRAERQAHRGP
jgi:hypothetical protein